MTGLRVFLLFISIFYLSIFQSAEARVFDFKSAGWSPYLRGTGGSDAMGQDAFIHSSGGGTTIKGKSNYNYSGEVGVNFNIAGLANLRLGAELISAVPLTNASGDNSSGVQRFTLNSNITAFNPNFALEILFHQRQSYRFYFGLGGGYAVGNMTNSYTMTTTGTSELGVSSYDEKATGKALSGVTSIGLETLFADNVTLSLEAGYRYLTISNWAHTGSVKTIAQGNVNEGDPVLNTGGTARRTDLGGPFVGLALRFYIDLGP